MLVKGPDDEWQRQTVIKEPVRKIGHSASGDRAVQLV
jgi:hypothetical protein